MAYRILSLDGGGVYGTYQAVLLRRLWEYRPDLIEKTDLIAGSSIGGIIALGLAAGRTPAEVQELLISGSAPVFRKSWWRHFTSSLGITAKHSNTALRGMLENAYGPTTRLIDLKKKVTVPAFRLDGPYGWEPKIFHNFPGKQPWQLGRMSMSAALEPHPSVDLDLAVDVGLATSAAPVYFPVYKGYVDGGLVTNNPAGLAMCKAIHAEATKLEDIHILSLGAHNSIDRLRISDANWGFLRWLLPLRRLLFTFGEVTVDFECRQLLKERYFRYYALLPESLRKSIDDPGLVPDLVKHASGCEIGYLEDWLDKNW